MNVCASNPDKTDLRCNLMDGYIDDFFLYSVLYFYALLFSSKNYTRNQVENISIMCVK